MYLFFVKSSIFIRFPTLLKNWLVRVDPLNYHSSSHQNFNSYEINKRFLKSIYPYLQLPFPILNYPQLNMPWEVWQVSYGASLDRYTLGLISYALFCCFVASLCTAACSLDISVLSMTQPRCVIVFCIALIDECGVTYIDIYSPRSGEEYNDTEWTPRSDIRTVFV